MSDFRTVRQVIGQRVRELRTQHERRQEHIADAARAVGLAWDQSRVAGLERGAKALSVEELLRLPLVMQLAGCGSPTLADLFTADRKESVALDGETRATAGLLRDVLDGEQYPAGTLHVAGQSVGRGFGLPGFAPVSGDGAAQPVEVPAEHRDAERTAAAKLGLTPREVVRRSRSLWGRSLTDERDGRLAERVTQNDSPERRTALSGRITRTLMAELLEDVEAHEPRLMDMRGATGITEGWRRDRRRAAVLADDAEPSEP